MQAKGMRHLLVLSLLLLPVFTTTACTQDDDDDEEIWVESKEDRINELESNQDEQITGDVTEEVEVVEEESTDSQTEADELFNKAIAGEIIVNATYEDGTDCSYYVTDLQFDEDEWDSYSIGDKVDLDNDGVDELIINGPYGGIYLDARDGAVYQLACGEGTAGELTYVNYNGSTYICHFDTSHSGREVYLLDEYNGNGEIVDSTSLMAEYWELGYYDETATCHFGDEEITTEQYEKLKQEIFGY